MRACVFVLLVIAWVHGSYAADADREQAPASSLVAALRAANPDYAYTPSTLSADAQKSIIKIRGCKGLSNIQPLTNVTFCTDLTLHGCGVDSLEPIRTFKLVRLDVGDCPVADLEPIRGMPLTELSLYNTRVKSLEPLRGMPLRTLKTNVTTPSFYDVIGSGGLPALEVLELAYCQLDPARLKDLKPTLKSLLLNHIQFSGKVPVDLNSFRDQPLTNLALNGTEVVAWSALSNLRHLTALSVRGGAFDSTQPLSGLPIETLTIQNAEPRPLMIDGIKSLPLKQLTLKNCTVDLKSLAGSPVQDIAFSAACISGGLEALRECPSLTSVLVFVLTDAGKEETRTFSGAKAAEELLLNLADGKLKLR